MCSQSISILRENFCLSFLIPFAWACRCSGQRHRWVFPGMVLAPRSHPDHLLGRTVAKLGAMRAAPTSPGTPRPWGQPCSWGHPSLRHPYSKGHPSLGTPHPCGRSILGDAPSLWSLHPLGHPSLGSPLFPHTYCQRPFLLRVFLEAARPQGWAQGSSPWYGELLCSITLPSPIPQAFCPLFFSFSFKNFSGSNDCLSTQVN